MKIFFIRLFYKLADPIRRSYWFIVRPTRMGVKCLIEHQNKFLFIRNSYGSKRWTIPGGGVNRGESLESAVIRETREEVNITPSNLINIGTYIHQKEYKHDSLTIFYTKTQSPKFTIDPVEIEEARWMTFDEVPQPRGSAITRAFSFFNTWNHEQH